MGQLRFWLLGALVILVLSEIIRRMFFRKAMGRVRVFAPVALAWLIGTPMGVWSESTDQAPPHWGSVVVRYAIPAVVVAMLYWLSEQRANT